MMDRAMHPSLESDHPKISVEVGTASMEILCERCPPNEARVVNIPIVLEETGEKIVHVPITSETDNPSINNAYVPYLPVQDRLRLENKLDRPPSFSGECEMTCGGEGVVAPKSAAVGERATGQLPDRQQSPALCPPATDSVTSASLTNDIPVAEGREGHDMVQEEELGTLGEYQKTERGTEQNEQANQGSAEPKEQTGSSPRNQQLSLPVTSSWTNQNTSTPFLPLDTPVEECIYQIKWTAFQNKDVPIVTQNKNGPCPLISLVNALLLSKRLNLSEGIEYQSGENLMSQLAAMVLESVPEKVTEEVRRNYEQNIQDALAILPKLQTGLDINVHFGGPRRYEFTQDTLLFDVLDVPLVHGWICDKEDEAAVVVEKHGSYNRLVEFIIMGKASDNCDTAGEALLAEDWLERTQTQLTYPGLVALVDCLQPDRPCVLFRNNHFSTIIKHDEQIYALVTDQGYATVADCVWEQLSNVEGNTDFFDDKFRPRVCTKSVPNTPSVFDARKQEELDFQLALSLSQSETVGRVLHDGRIIDRAEMEKENVEVEPKDQEMSPALSDYELAKSLQAVEDAAVVIPSPRLAPPVPQLPRPAVPVSQSAFELKERSAVPPSASTASPYPSSRPNFGRRHSNERQQEQRSTPMPHSTSMTVRSTGPTTRRLPRVDQEKKEKCVIS
ncbi:hypothetical protein RvY_16963 [Ramazzottius varieornatus]|uniref:Ubiquitin carboxyl-terminal hydrolase n=1 Tax=Ramazzottius varieornatus TaxID=947166 RepID=A0A1D1W0Z4_RAMVA|nr:hypothetical protein RvY_16963 [Ramazzottius varieornatus]